MQFLSRALSAATLGCVIQSVSSDAFYSTQHDLLSALAWSSLDFSDVPSLQHRSLLKSEHHENSINSTALVAKPRKKRTITLHPKELYVGLEYRFKLPLFQVYESTAFFLEVPIDFHHELHGVVTTGRSWDLIKPLLQNAEALVSLLGVDGGACLRRAVCELASAPSIRPHGFIGEVIQIFVKDLIKAEYRIRDMENEIDSLHGEYMEAGRHGKEKGECWKAFPECNVSFAELFSDVKI
ncbi:uncharacterized protein LOC122257829 [Penaeus japonicus]|uniref:uncharacterized protein LOC122257829 n=1 Tax=Penaeus japonicus TaxID=27405 RepID=UPI001C717009|nr:uncharacterized protein LOC122257829 [Penaeus japonicus]